MQTLGRKIRLLRQQRGWNQQDVAKLLDLSTPAYSKIETGITDVNLSRLHQISALYEMSVVQLLSDQGNEPEDQNNSTREAMSQKIQAREAEIMNLQQRVIELYDELRLLSSR